jgi:hypothetical protein
VNRLALLALFVLSCRSKEDSGRPVFTDAMRAQLASLASKCEEHRLPPDIDLLIACVAPDDPNRARVDVMIVNNGVEGINVTLREASSEAALVKLGAAIVGIVNDRARAMIVDTLRATRGEPDDLGWGRAELEGEALALVYVKRLEVGQIEYTLQLMFGPKAKPHP